MPKINGFSRITYKYNGQLGKPIPKQKFEDFSRQYGYYLNTEKDTMFVVNGDGVVWCGMSSMFKYNGEHWEHDFNGKLCKMTGGKVEITIEIPER